MDNKVLSIEAKNNKWTLTPAGLEFAADATKEDWDEAGRWLKFVESKFLFLLGDWVSYGLDRFGKDAISDQLDLFEFQQVRQALQLGLFETEQRYPSLSADHHLVVRSLDEDGRKRWLDLAVEENMTARQLAAALKEASGGTRNKFKGIASPSGVRGNFDLWMKGVGDRQTVLEMPEMERVAIYEELKPVAELVQALENSLRTQREQSRV
ncbi:MAG: hypothetical protein AAF571_03420 [Verrucomicrobiota bacterium]